MFSLEEGRKGGRGKSHFCVYVLPTNSGLLINFRLSSDAETLSTSANWACKSVPNVQGRTCNVYTFQPSFHFAYHHWWLGPPTTQTEYSKGNSDLKFDFAREKKVVLPARYSETLIIQDRLVHDGPQLFSPNCLSLPACLSVCLLVCTLVSSCSQFDCTCTSATTNSLD